MDQKVSAITLCTALLFASFLPAMAEPGTNQPVKDAALLAPSSQAVLPPNIESGKPDIENQITKEKGSTKDQNGAADDVRKHEQVDNEVPPSPAKPLASPALEGQQPPTDKRNATEHGQQGASESNNETHECLDDSCREDSLRLVERDLAAQESMASAAWLMYWVAVVQTSFILLTVVISGATLWLLKRTLEATKLAALGAQASAHEAQRTASAAIDANKLAQDNFLAQHRPWLTVQLELPQTLLVHEDQTAYPEVKVKVTNSTNTPAINVRWMLRAWCSPGYPKISATTIQKSLRSLVNAPGIDAITIARDPITFLEPHLKLEARDDYSMCPTLYGGVVYESPYDNKTHLTTFAYNLCGVESFVLGQERGRSLEALRPNRTYLSTGLALEPCAAAITMT